MKRCKITLSCKNLFDQFNIHILWWKMSPTNSSSCTHTCIWCCFHVRIFRHKVSSNTVINRDFTTETWRNACDGFLTGVYRWNITRLGVMISIRAEQIFSKTFLWVLGILKSTEADIWSPLNLQVKNEFVFLLLSQLIKMIKKKMQFSQTTLELRNWSTIF